MQSGSNNQEIGQAMEVDEHFKKEESCYDKNENQVKIGLQEPEAATNKVT